MAFKIGNVDQRSIDGVFGYMKSNALAIPKDIKVLCLQYYYNPEYFAQANDDFKISDDGMRVTARNICSFANHSIFGNRWIESMSNVIVKWTVSVDKLGDHMYFGIASKFMDIHKDFGLNEASAHPNYAVSNNAIRYRYDGNTEHEELNFEDFDFHFNAGSVIVYTLDLGKATFSMQIDEKAPFIVFDAIKRATEIRYKMAVQIRSKGDQLTLLSYQELYP